MFKARSLMVILILLLPTLTIFSTGVKGDMGGWTTKAPMPTARGYMSSATVGSKIYVIGGDQPSGFLSVNEAYDPATDSWTSVSNMPTTRCFPVSGVVDGKIYVIGGLSDTGGWYSSSVNEMYDPQSDTWFEKAPMPIFGRHAATGATVNGKIYVIGGYCPPYNAQIMLDWNEAYDPSTDSWQSSLNNQLEPMPTARRNLAAAVVDGKIYAIGGSSMSGELGTNEMYDPATNAWSTKTSMPTPREGLTLAVLGDKIFAIGGRIQSPPTYPATNTVEVYDTTTDTWTSSESMTTPRYAMASQTVSGVIYIIGGWDTSNTVISINESFGKALDEGWSIAGTLPLPVSTTMTFTSGGRIYTIGGSTATWISSADVNYATINPDGTLGQCISTTPLPNVREDSGVAEYNGRVYIIAGTGPEPPPTERNTVYSATINIDGSLGNWTETMPLPQPLTEFATVQWNSRIYIIGGWNGGGSQSTVYTSEIQPDGTLSAWSSLQELPQPLWRFSAAVLNNYIYTFGSRMQGGSPGDPGFNVVYYSKINEDGTIQPWLSATELPVGLNFHTSAAVNGKVYVIGGSNVNDWVPTDATWIATANPDGSLGAWSAGEPLPQALIGQRAFAYNGAVYTVGGLARVGDEYIRTDKVYRLQSGSAPAPTTYKVTVTVVDSTDSSPIPGATVTLESSSATTGDNGVAQFDGILSGSYVLHLSKSGYDSTTLSITVSSNTQVNVLLTPSPPTPINWPEWAKKMQVILRENGGHDLQGYPIQVVMDTATEVSSGFMKADCSDIRVVDESAMTALPYSITNPNSANTIITFRVDLSASAEKSDIYIYYGNPSAEPVAKPFNKIYYTFYDDFEAGLSKWGSDNGNDGKNYISDGQFCQDTESGQWHYSNIWTLQSFPSNQNWEISFDFYNSEQNSYGWAIFGDEAYVGKEYFEGNTPYASIYGSTQYYDGFPSWWYIFDSASQGRMVSKQYIDSGWFHEKIVYDYSSNQLNVWLNGNQICSTSMDELMPSTRQLKFGHVYQCGGGIPQPVLDNVAIKLYTSMEPTVILMSAVPSYNLPSSVEGSGTITRDPDQLMYPYGSVVTLTATTTSGWTFTGWSGDLTGSENPCTINIGTVQKVAATFTFPTCSLSTSINGMGTVSKDPNLTKYPLGSTVTLTATPASGWKFTGWSGDLTGTISPSTIVLDTDKNIAANFEQIITIPYESTMRWDPTQLKLDFPLSCSSTLINGDTIYVIGGLDEQGIVDTIFFGKLNPNGQVLAWNHATLPQARFSRTSFATIWDNYLYVCGGGGPNSPQETNTVWYTKLNPDGSLGGWQVSEYPLDTQLQSQVVTSDHGHIYIVGGWTGYQWEDNIWVADINPNTHSIGPWREETQKLPEPRAHGQAGTIYNGYIYISGGHFPDYKLHDTIFYSKLDENGDIVNWNSTRALPQPMEYHSLAILGGKMYVVGGNVGEWNYQVVKNVYRADINPEDGSLGQWVEDTSLPQERIMSGSATYNGHIYIVGGQTQSGTKTDTIYISSPLDDVPPTTSATVDPQPNTNGWINRAASLTLQATDESGVSATYYEVDNGNWADYNSPITIGEEGLHTVNFYSVDAAGNHESAQCININIDFTPPTIILTTPSDYGIYSSGSKATFTFSATDNLDLNPTLSASLTLFDGEYLSITSGSPLPTSAGVYTLTVTAKDSAGNTAQKSATFVVYDSTAGFVTGGGWINSPTGAYQLDLTLTGKATFAFESKYKKGATVPDGNTEFKFQTAGLSFKSSSYEWMVIAGSKAQYKGEGTINGAGVYNFMLTAIDGDLIGKGKPDMFRMKIWDKATGIHIYDNQLGASDMADPTTAIVGGSIVIHK